MSKVIRVCLKGQVDVKKKFQNDVSEMIKCVYWN